MDRKREEENGGGKRERDYETVYEMPHNIYTLRSHVVTVARINSLTRGYDYGQ